MILATVVLSLSIFHFIHVTQSFGASSGLYSPTDKVAILTADNFNENVYNSSSAWLVQFYNSWCGHCIKFSPVWKQLGADVYSEFHSFL